MRVFKITLSYDGTEYGGWQIQPNSVTVQERLEQAICKVTGNSTRAIASGRTDAGVHAIGQVVACKLDTRLNCDTLRRALNASLPSDIRISDISSAPDDFHPIRDATSKRYRYVIQHGGTANVFARTTSWFIPKHLNVAAMQAAAQALVGTFDCKSFETAGAPRKSSVRRIMASDLQSIRRDGCDWLYYEVEANGFLYNMVRNIVGTLVDVGREKHPPTWIHELIELRDRRHAGATAPPQGLFLLRVNYPDQC